MNGYLKWAAVAAALAAVLAIWLCWPESGPKPEPQPAASSVQAPPAPAEKSLAQAPPSDAPAKPASAAASAPAPSKPKIAFAKNDGGETIGSEGYGPHIERIAASGTPAQAMAALQWLAACDSSVQVINAMQAQRARDGDRGGLYTGIIEEAETNIRRCQTVTPEIKALAPSLGLAAVQGGVEGAAAAYLASMRLDLPADQRALVLQHLQADAQAGDEPSLLYLAQLSPLLGLSAAEQANYVAALAQLPRYAPVTNIVNGQLAGRSTPLPPPDPAVVKTLVDAIKARQPPVLGTINAASPPPTGH